MRLAVFTLILVGLFAAPLMAAGDAAKGKVIYDTICQACHGPDPKVDGPLGPSIHGSAKPLVEMRVLQAKYPPGYKPKRDTALMPPFPQYKDDIDNIVAFLNK